MQIFFACYFCSEVCYVNSCEIQSVNFMDWLGTKAVQCTFTKKKHQKDLQILTSASSQNHNLTSHILVLKKNLSFNKSSWAMDISSTDNLIRGSQFSNFCYKPMIGIYKQLIHKSKIKLLIFTRYGNSFCFIIMFMLIPNFYQI